MCYIFGPLLGATVAGSVFNHMKETKEDMESWLIDGVNEALSESGKSVDHAEDDDGDDMV